MAGKLAVTAYVHVSGPLFDGHAAAAVTRFEAGARRAVADEGVGMLRAVHMDKTGRARGGFQQALHVVDKGAFLKIPAPMIKGVTWGPWLEGTSKRNTSTGFKGYRLFRRTRLELDRKATDIAERELAKYLPEMGGDA